MGLFPLDVDGGYGPGLNTLKQVNVHILKSVRGFERGSRGASGHLPRPATLHPPASYIHALLPPHHLCPRSPAVRTRALVTHRTGRTWPRYSRLRSTTLCQHVEKWEPGAQLSSCHYTRLDFKVELWACVRNTCFKFQARLAWHISCAFIQLYCMNSATRWYYWLTFFFFFLHLCEVSPLKPIT